MTRINIPAPSQDGLSHYLQRIHRYPLLGADVERELAVRRREQGDAEAGQLLAQSYLRLVVKVAVGYKGYNVPLSDLIAEGNIGLMQAIERFDPERGFRLSTYAVWWIRAAIHDYLLRWVSSVRIGTSASQKKLFFNLRRMAAARTVPGETTLSSEAVAEIARELNVKEADVLTMNERLKGDTYSLNTPTGEDGDTEFQDLLVDDAPLPEAVVADAEELSRRREFLTEAMGALKDRERDILTERRLRERPMTLEELGDRYGVTRERIRQIEFRALEKVKIAMTRSMSAARADCLRARERVAMEGLDALPGMFSLSRREAERSELEPA